MRKLSKDESKSLIKKLDRIATEIEQNGWQYGIPTREDAQKLAERLDKVSDFLQKEAGLKTAEVYQSEKDEPYMEAYNQPGTMQQDADENYMKDFENPVEVAGVMKHPESNVEGLSEWSDPSAKQPSWRGPVQNRPKPGEYTRTSSTERYTPKTEAGKKLASELK